MSNLSDIRHAVEKTTMQDLIRRDCLKKMHDLVKRDVILYATQFSHPVQNIPGIFTSINDADVQHLMSVISELRCTDRPRSKSLDLILHSPGGSLASAEQIVCYLRKQYEYIRVIVPLNAMSAATMIACAADEILLGHHSALGPTDPQIQSGKGYVAAQSIINEFNKAKEEVKEDMSTLPLWTSRIANWPPGLLDQCDRVIKLSEEVVADWLQRYMNLNSTDAKYAAQKLANADEHKIHNRPLDFDKLKSLKLKVKRLEDDQDLQDAVLSVFHATTVTFEITSCVKIVESDLGKGVFQILRHSN